MIRADVTLITSLYRAEPFLPEYANAVLDLVRETDRADLGVEIVLVPNDATERERLLIDALRRAVDESSSLGSVKIAPTSLESIYASWNRGVRAASGRVIGFWGVDDVRHAEAIIEGCGLVDEGCDIVDFPGAVKLERKGVFGYRRTSEIIVSSVDDYPAHHISPFFLAARTCFERFGLFDDYFRINGDMEWTVRATARGARRCFGRSPAGLFHLHGGNLSANRPDMDVEIDLIHLRQGVWQELRFAEPRKLRQAWEGWPGAEGVEVPQDVQDRLWGDRAQRYWRNRHWRKPLDACVRRPARTMRDLWYRMIRSPADR